LDDEVLGLLSLTFGSEAGVGAVGFTAPLVAGAALAAGAALSGVAAFAGVEPFAGVAALAGVAPPLAGDVSFVVAAGLAVETPLAAGFGVAGAAAAFAGALGAGFAAGVGLAVAAGLAGALGTGLAVFGSGLADFAVGFTAGFAAAGRTGFLPGEALGFLLIWMPAGSRPGPWKRTGNYTGKRGSRPDFGA
jgi:hypothetical protein